MADKTEKKSFYSIFNTHKAKSSKAAKSSILNVTSSSDTSVHSDNIAPVPVVVEPVDSSPSHSRKHASNTDISVAVPIVSDMPSSSSSKSVPLQLSCSVAADDNYMLTQESAKIHTVALHQAVLRLKRYAESLVQFVTDM